MVVFLLQGYLRTGQEVQCFRAPSCYSAASACTGWSRFGHCSGSMHCNMCLRCLQALVRTLYVSGVFAAADTLIKIVFVFGMHIPLFLYGCGPVHDDNTTVSVC